MSRAVLTSSLPLAALAVLGILAACDVNDSPQHAGSPMAATFAPRIQAPAGGFRKADWLALTVWKENTEVGGWEFHYFRDSIAPTKPSVSVTVPLNVKLKYRVAGYVVSFTNGVRSIDTVWTALDSSFYVYDTNAVSKSAATKARNWAIAPTTLIPANAVFTPGNVAEFRASSGQFVAIGSDSTVSCSGAKDTVAKVTALLQSPLVAWVRSCGDTSVVPSAVRRYSWTIDTAGIGLRRAPLPPVPSGVSGFQDLDQLASAQSSPTVAVPFAISEADEIIAWAFSLSDKAIVPDPSEYPAAPGSIASAPFASRTGLLDLWSAIKDSLARHSSGMRVAVTTVRIDTGLGKEWISTPVRFWFQVTPPELPSRFGLTTLRWDSIQVDWDLSNPGLNYSAWYGVGDADPDSARAQVLPPAATRSPIWTIGGLPSDTTISLLLKASDPRTGLSSSLVKKARTGALPAIPTPRLVWPNTNPAVLKQSTQTSIHAQVGTDSAGRTLKLRYAILVRQKATTPVPSAQAWPDLSDPGTPSLLSADSSLAIAAKPGEYVYLSYVAEDPAGHRSAVSGQQLLEIVADDVDVPPSAPTNLKIVSRTASSIDLEWDALSGFGYRLRWSIGGQRATVQDLDSSHFRISGLASGTVVDSIAVLAVQIGNGARISGYSSPDLVARTRNPPGAPALATSEWITEGSVLKLRWRWVREPATAEGIAVVGVPDATTVPGSASWSFTPATTAGGKDSIDIPYQNLLAQPVVAFGRRAFRDSLETGPVWSFANIPQIAPAVMGDSLRIWQHGNTMRVIAPSGPEQAGFQLRARVFQIVQGTVTTDTTVTIQRGTGELQLDTFVPGNVSAFFWWERSPKTGVAKFDRGEELSRTRIILPAPSGFSLLPGSYEKEWLFRPPTDLASGSQALLVRTLGTTVAAEVVVSGSIISSSPLDGESFALAQVVGNDTSMTTPARSLRMLTAMPVASPPHGSYLFPFPIALSATEGQVQVSQGTEWKDASSAFDPFAFGPFSARIAGPFTVGPPKALEYVQDTGFGGANWPKMVEQGLAGGIGKTWVAVENGEMSYTAGSSRTPATIDLLQGAKDTLALGFAVDPVKGATFDASDALGILIGVAKANAVNSYRVSIQATDGSGGSLLIHLPAILVGSQIKAPFRANTLTTVLPIVTYGGRTTKAVAWSDVPALLRSVEVVRLHLTTTDFTTAGTASITSLKVIPSGGKL